MDRCVNPECRRAGATQARGLCHKCYDTPAIRARFPKKKIGPKVGWKKNWHEPTEEELNQIIAEQLPSMPAGNGDEMDEETTAIKRRIARKNRK